MNNLQNAKPTVMILVPYPLYPDECLPEYIKSIKDEIKQLWKTKYSEYKLLNITSDVANLDFLERLHKYMRMMMYKADLIVFGGEWYRDHTCIQLKRFLDELVYQGEDGPFVTFETKVTDKYTNDEDGISRLYASKLYNTKAKDHIIHVCNLSHDLSLYDPDFEVIPSQQCLDRPIDNRISFNVNIISNDEMQTLQLVEVTGKYIPNRKEDDEE